MMCRSRELMRNNEDNMGFIPREGTQKYLPKQQYLSRTSYWEIQSFSKPSTILTPKYKIPKIRTILGSIVFSFATPPDSFATSLALPFQGRQNHRQTHQGPRIEEILTV